MHRSIAVLLSLAGLAGLPAGAAATTTVSKTGTTVQVVSGAERNVVGLAIDADSIVVTESGGGGIAVDLLSMGTCTRSGTEVRCPATGLTGVDVRLGAGDDTLTTLPTVKAPVRASGEDGDDTLAGGPANDELDGGAGGDLVSYAGATRAVAVTLGAGGAETRGNGVVAADPQPAEDDALVGFEGARGGPFSNQLTGNELDNQLLGGGRADALDGGGGSDRIEGGAGADGLTGGPGRDTLLGQAGDDTLQARDDAADAPADCGDGDDDVVADAGLDELAACEVAAPQVTARSSLVGPFMVGDTVGFAPGMLSGSPAMLTRRDWFRCAPDRTACARVATLSADAVPLSAASVDKILVLTLTWSNRAGSVLDETDPSPVITRPEPAPRPAATPQPGSSGSGSGTGGGAGAGTFGRATAVVLARTAAAKLRRRGSRLGLTAGQRVTCRAVPRDCGVNVTATMRVPRRSGGKRRGSRTAEVGYRSDVLEPGKSADISLKLSRAARKAVKGKRRVVITLKIVARQAGSDDVTKTLRLRVAVPRRGR